MRSLTLGVVLVCVTTPLSGQVIMRPGSAHDRLDFLVGDWVVETTMHFRGETHVAHNPTTISWLPGGVWLLQLTDIPASPVGPMHGSAQIGWDDRNDVYVRHWLDNQSTVVLTTRGAFADDSTLVFRGSFEWVDGTVYHERIEIQRHADGSWTETGYLGVDPANLPLNHVGKARHR